MAQTGLVGQVLKPAVYLIRRKIFKITELPYKYDGAGPQYYEKETGPLIPDIDQHQSQHAQKECNQVNKQDRASGCQSHAHHAMMNMVVVG